MAFKKLKTLTLKQVGNAFMQVEVNDNEVNLTNVYTMNATAASLWTQLDNPDATVDSLAAAICEEYEVDHDTAAADIRAQLGQWATMGLIDETGF